MNFKNYFKKNLFEAISREQMTPEKSDIPMGPPVDGDSGGYYRPYQEFDRQRLNNHPEWYTYYPDHLRNPSGWGIPPIPPNLLNKPLDQMTQDELALYYEFMKALYEVWRSIRPHPAGPMPTRFWPFPTGVNPWTPIPYPEYYTNPDIMPPFIPPHPLGIDQPGGWGWDPYFEQWHYVWG